MDLNINEAFADLFIIVNGKPTQLNVIGAIKVEDRELVVLSDMEGLVGQDEYMVYEIIRNEENITLTEIRDMEFYNHVCDMWETYLDELEDTEIDS